ncbi:MAG: DUF3857 and transglutaminase domain-containing protein [Candidatus Omnitrophota bacterium]
MKKNILFISVVSFILLAQSLIFGAEQKEAVSFEEQHKDKDAIFLLFDVNITVNDDWSYVSKVHQRTKILKEEARDWGEVQLDYDKGRDKIIVEQAYSITPDGKKHKYSKIQDLKSYDGYPIYSDSMIKIITLPEVNVGSVIEREITKVSQGFPMKDAFWYLFDFDFAIPTKEINFTITWPKKLKIQYKAFNLDYEPTITENASTITYSWHLKNMYEAAETEDYLPPPTPENVTSAAEFSSIQNWSNISDWFYALVQKNLRINSQIEEAAKKVLKDKTTAKDKTRAVLEYIQDNFRYVSMSLGPHSLEPHPTDEVFKNKYGDCKDLSLLCVAMLKVAGIESNVALFRDEFSITDPKYDLPIPTLFDHAIVLVKDEKGESFYVDPQLKGYDIGEYPLYFQNAYMFVITADGGKFGRLPIFPEERMSTRRDINTVINSDGSALSEINSFWPLDTSIDTREKLKGLDNTQREDFYQRLNAMLADGGEVLERRWENFDSRYGRLKSYLKVRQRDAYLVSDGMIILDIAGYERDIEFTKDKRENPIFYPGDTCDEIITTYQIPKGFRVLSIPGNIEKDIGFFSVKREFKRDKDKVTIHEVAKHKRIEIPKEQYPRVKEFFDKLPSQTQQRIVLKRTKSWQQKLKEIWAIIRQ